MKLKFSRMHTVRSKQRGNAVFGLFVFFLGVLLIGFSFKLALDMFLIPPEIRVSTGPEQTIKVDTLIENILQVLVKVLLLVVMSGIGSLIATRGIKLYSHRQPRVKPDPETKSDLPMAP